MAVGPCKARSVRQREEPTSVQSGGVRAPPPPKTAPERLGPRGSPFPAQKYTYRQRRVREMGGEAAEMAAAAERVMLGNKRG